MTHRNYIAILAATAAIVSTPALASPTINFSIQTNQFNKPSMEFKYQGGKYVWDAKPINTQFSASANTGSLYLVWVTHLFVESLGVGPHSVFPTNAPFGLQNWTHQGPLSLSVNFLNSYQANFAAFCEANGTTKPLLQELSIVFNVRQQYIEQNKGVHKKPQAIDGTTGEFLGTWVNRTVNMPVTVVCGPKPIPQPGAVAHDKGSFKVQAIDLKFTTSSHSNTRPNHATVCKKALLSVSLKTNQAGPTQFRLWTKKGAATANKVINAWSSHDGKGFFFAKHQEWVEVDATTYIQAKAEEMVNAVELSTPWKSITLHCTGAGGGGLVNDPGNLNPDNQIPDKPKAPKRAFDGTAGSGFVPTPTNANPDNRIPTKPAAPKRRIQGGPTGVTAGANPTHSQPQPQRAPSVKTAPAPKATTRPVRRRTPDTQGNLTTPQRESGFLLPAIQKVR